MGLITRQPRELLAVKYTSTDTTTDTTADGAAFSPAWGGSFDIAELTTVDIEIWVPQITNNGAALVFFQLYLDSVTQGTRGFYTWAASVPHYGMSGKWRVSALSAGSHTVAVRKRVSAGTGTYTMTSADHGLLTVREVV
jgi:hypothetical protein